ncbi:alpha/beta hydrolase [Mycoplasmatota bacterium]|nr:alpha/beta hydrolase [Mycoplasmatota bacterium]
MKKVKIELNKHLDIPYLLYYLENSKNCPLVIMGHGFNNDKYEGSDIAIKLASKEVCVLSFDLYKQGERYDGFLDKVKSDAEFGYTLFNIIKKSNEDLLKLIDFFKQDDKVDASKIGMLGFSLGANLCFYSFANNKDLKFAVPILGSPDFTNLLIYSMEKENESDFKTQEEIKLLEFIKGIDPYDNLVQNENRHLFIINGTKDDDVPSRFSENFYQEIKKRYDLNDSKVELLITDDNHYVSNEMKDNAIEWIINNIL